MPYKVSIQEEREYIRVEVTGERGRGQEATDSKEFWLGMANLCNDKGVYGILAIFNLTGRLPMMAGHEVGTWVVETKLLTELKIAVVDLNDESRINNQFIETFAGNRTRYDRGKVFDDEKAALEWLLQ